MSASYLDICLNLEIYSKGRLKTKLYDKRDDFNFPDPLTYMAPHAILVSDWLISTKSSLKLHCQMN